MTGSSGSDQILLDLEDANAFVVSVDRWQYPARSIANIWRARLTIFPAKLVPDANTPKVWIPMKLSVSRPDLEISVFKEAGQCYM